MGFFKNKCRYCKKKIEKGKEVFRDVKDPVSIMTKPKAFCCSEHADNYECEVSNVKKCGRSCCG